jgi:hypothetical protein
VVCIEKENKQYCTPAAANFINTTSRFIDKKKQALLLQRHKFHHHSFGYIIAKSSKSVPFLHN